MKQYKCVQVDHHIKVGEKIEEYVGNGWVLNTYKPINVGMTSSINHYLLFEREKTGNQE